MAGPSDNFNGKKLLFAPDRTVGDTARVRLVVGMAAKQAMEAGASEEQFLQHVVDLGPQLRVALRPVASTTHVIIAIDSAP